MIETDSAGDTFTESNLNLVVGNMSERILMISRCRVSCDELICGGKRMLELLFYFVAEMNG